LHSALYQIDQIEAGQCNSFKYSEHDPNIKCHEKTYDMDALAGERTVHCGLYQKH
jgi:hypothetical protein